MGIDKQGARDQASHWRALHDFEFMVSEYEVDHEGELVAYAAEATKELQAKVLELESERDEWDRKEDSWKHAAIKQQHRAEAAETALAEAQAKLESRWRCYHCGFVATSEEEAEGHFGDGDEAEEFVPVCKWWANSDEDERKRAYQDLLIELNGARNDASRTRELEASLDDERRLRDDNRRQLQKEFGSDCTSVWLAGDRYNNLKFELAEAQKDGEILKWMLHHEAQIIPSPGTPYRYQLSYVEDGVAFITLPFDTSKAAINAAMRESRIDALVELPSKDAK